MGAGECPEPKFGWGYNEGEVPSTSYRGTNLLGVFLSVHQREQKIVSNRMNFLWFIML